MVWDKDCPDERSCTILCSEKIRLHSHSFKISGAMCRALTNDPKAIILPVGSAFKGPDQTVPFHVENERPVGGAVARGEIQVDVGNNG